MARRIRASGPRVLLVVVARQAHDMARARQGDGALLCPTLVSGVRPRLCHIVRDEGGFGFSVTHGELQGSRSGGEVKGSQPRPGQPDSHLLFFRGGGVLPEHQGSFWLVLSPGGAAERAGVPPGARLLEVNGLSVEKLTHSQLSRRVGRALSPLPFSSTEPPDLLLHLHHPFRFQCVLRPLSLPQCLLLGLGRGAVKGRPPFSWF